MEKYSETDIDSAAAMLRVLGEPIRFRIMLLLEERSWLVNELAAALAIEQSSLSHHMQVLRAHHLVRGTREGKAVRYEPNDLHVYSIINQVMEHVQEEDSEELI